MTAFSCLDRIYVADDVSNGHVGRGELFHKPRITIDPCDWQRVTMKFQLFTTKRGDRSKRIVVNLRPGNHRNLFVEQFRKLANDPTLRLAPEAKQNDVVFGKNRVDELGKYSFVVTNDSGKEFFSGLQLADQIAAQFVLNGNTPVAAGL